MANAPGTFEFVHEKLHWWSQSPNLAKEAQTGDAALELLNSRAKLIDLNVDCPVDQGGQLCFRIGRTAPAFARFRRKNGRLTGTAIVTSVDELRNRTRDAPSAKSKRTITARRGARGHPRSRL